MLLFSGIPGFSKLTLGAFKAAASEIKEAFAVRIHDEVKAYAPLVRKQNAMHVIMDQMSLTIRENEDHNETKDMNILNMGGIATNCAISLFNEIEKLTGYDLTGVQAEKLISYGDEAMEGCLDVAEECEKCIAHYTHDSGNVPDTLRPFSNQIIRDRQIAREYCLYLAQELVEATDRKDLKELAARLDTRVEIAPNKKDITFSRFVRAEIEKKMPKLGKDVDPRL